MPTVELAFNHNNNLEFSDPISLASHNKLILNNSNKDNKVEVLFGMMNNLFRNFTGYN